MRSGSDLPLSRKGGILELLDRIEAYVLRHGKLPAALYLELRQAVEELDG
jgi:hypothetical protein